MIDVVDAKSFAVVRVPANQVGEGGRTPCRLVDDIVDSWLLPRVASRTWDNAVGVEPKMVRDEVGWVKKRSHR